MHSHEDHHELIDDLRRQLAGIFELSKQGVYLYLDDNHKACNRKFALLLGYKSQKQWEQVEETFTQAFVSPKSQKTLASTYRAAMEDFVGSSVDIWWKKQGGGEVKTKVILVPVMFEGHTFALHFVSF